MPNKIKYQSETYELNNKDNVYYRLDKAKGHDYGNCLMGYVYQMDLNDEIEIIEEYFRNAS